MSTTPLRKFVAPEIVFGAGARLLAGKYARNLGARKVLIVTDPGVTAAGWLSGVTASLDEAGVEFSIFDGISPNPRSAEVMAGAEAYRAGGCQTIISLGGGSPMDCAKGIGIVRSCGGHILDYAGVDMITAPCPPLIFVPTTAGTSSDVSQFSIILDEKELTKIAIISKALVPDVALIDFETTATMPPYLTACTGMDALVHAVEAFVSKASSPLTDIHALEAVRTVFAYLPGAVANGGDEMCRRKVMFASLQAGLAFSNAILGAVHSMAHSLGGFLDLAHGECNAILLEHVIDFNYLEAPERYDEIARAAGIGVDALDPSKRRAALVDRIRELKRTIGITGGLARVGVKSSDIPTLSVKAHRDPCLLTNPRAASLRDIEVIYEAAL